MRVKLMIVATLFLSACYADASAQTPQQFPSYSTPNSSGRVGQLPTYTSQLPNGAPVAHPSGQPPIFGTPTPNGGYVIPQQPGQQPTYLNPQ
jgi:hypothetical protein